MTRPRSRLAASLRRLWRREHGNATVEFVVLVPLALSILLAGIESGMIMARHTMLERGLDVTMRALRLGQMTPITQDRLREAVCRASIVVPNCEANLLIELRRLGGTSFTLPSMDAPCVERAEEITPAVELTPGAEHDLMLVRVCLIYDPLFPTTGWGLGLPVDASGGFRMAAASIYVNEPR